MDSYSDLSTVRRRVWHRLELAAEQPGHPFRALVFGTVQEQQPHLRTVIVRTADAESRVLMFHSDRRAQKIDDIRGGARIGWLGWDPEAREQVRLVGAASVHTDDQIADDMWEAESPSSLDVYVRSVPPGTPVDEPGAGRPDSARPGSPTRGQVEEGRSSFAVVRTVIDEIDWLHLHPEGHARAQFQFNVERGRFEGTWVVP